MSLDGLWLQGLAALTLVTVRQSVRLQRLGHIDAGMLQAVVQHIPASSRGGGGGGGGTAGRKGRQGMGAATREPPRWCPVLPATRGKGLDRRWPLALTTALLTAELGRPQVVGVVGAACGGGGAMAHVW